MLWVTCGNVSNAALEGLFSTAWERVVAAFASGEALVELAGGDGQRDTMTAETHRDGQ